MHIMDDVNIVYTGTLMKMLTICKRKKNIRREKDTQGIGSKECVSQK